MLFRSGIGVVGRLGDAAIDFAAAGDGKIIFSGNSASRNGGAIFNLSNNATSKVNLTVGDKGKISFVQNSTSNNGGGIYAHSSNNATAIFLRTGDGGSIEFTNNMSHGYGGALFLSGSNNTLSLSGGDNSSIVFRGNKQNVDVSENIPQNNTGVANAVAFTGKTTFNFNIDKNGLIAFYDPIMSEDTARATVNLNDPLSRGIDDIISNGLLLFDGKDYIDADPVNRYNNMISDTIVHNGAFAVANNVIYGRYESELGLTDNLSTLVINPGAALLSVNSVTGHIINNIINADVTNNGSLWFTNENRDTYNKLTLNTLKGSSDIHMSFNSDSGNSDVLQMVENAAGSHTVSAIGIGAGSLKRIENVIIVGTASNANTFTGGGSAGLYNYDLEQNRIGNWDLVRGSTNDTGDVTVESVAVMPIGWFTQLSNLNKRLGQLHAENYDIYDQDVWVRSFGGKVNAKLDNKTLVPFRSYEFGFDLGGDVLAIENENDKTIAGLYGGYMQANRKFADEASSTGKTKSYYGGFYGTWIDNEGLYFDLVGKVQEDKTKFTTDQDRANFSRTGIGASLEVGKPYQMNDGYFVEPRAQFAYLHLNSTDFRLKNSRIKISTDSADIYRLLGGVKFGQTTSVGDSDKPFIWYVSADIESQTSNGGKIHVADEAIDVNTDGVRSILGLGVMYDDSDFSQCYFNFETSFGEKYNRPWNVIAGYRMMF